MNYFQHAGFPSTDLRSFNVWWLYLCSIISGICLSTVDHGWVILTVVTLGLLQIYRQILKYVSLIYIH